MLIRRCAWHREFHGRSLLHGVASWRGLSVKFTDGVCRRCAARVRAEWHLARVQADARPARRRGPGAYRRVALLAGLAALVATVAPTRPFTDVFRGEQPARAVPGGGGDGAARRRCGEPPPQISSAAPLMGVARSRTAEDELTRAAHRHSVARLSLTPPEERPRHAGLAVQTP
jgi:hypothetical protein